MGLRRRSWSGALMVSAAALSMGAAGQTPGVDYGRAPAGSPTGQGPVRLAPLTLPSLALQPITPNRNQNSQPAAPAYPTPNDRGNVASPATLPVNSPLAAPASSPFMAAERPVYGYGYGFPGTSGAPAAGQAGSAEARNPTGLIAPNVLQPTLLQPVLLLEPRELGPSPARVAILTIDPASLLGSYSSTEPKARESEAQTGVPGLADDRYGVLKSATLAHSGAGLAPAARPVNLTLSVLGFGPLGPDASLPPMAPLQVLPFPGMRSGGPAVPAAVAAPSYGNGSPFLYGSGIGLALDAFSMVGGRFSAPSIGNMLPSLPVGPPSPGY